MPQAKLTAGEIFDLEAEAAPELIPFLTGNSLIVELGSGSLANSERGTIAVRFCRQASVVEVCNNGERVQAVQRCPVLSVKLVVECHRGSREAERRWLGADG